MPPIPDLTNEDERGLDRRFKRPKLTGSRVRKAPWVDQATYKEPSDEKSNEPSCGRHASQYNTPTCHDKGNVYRKAELDKKICGDRLEKQLGDAGRLYTRIKRGVRWES